MKTRKITTGCLALLFVLLSNIVAAAGGAVTYFHTDALGSPVSATNAAGEILWHERYMPYGSRINSEATDEENELWFTGKRQDSTTGLVDMGARQYDPEIARFYSTDPVGFVTDNTMSFNRYLYVNNNPYRYTDPEGEFLNNAVGGFYAGLQNAAIQYAEISLGVRSEFSFGELALDVGVGALTSGVSSIKNTARLASLIKRVAKNGGNQSKKGGCSVCDGYCCFVAGTEVLTKDGYQAIETLVTGDLILSKDVESGTQDWKPVSQLFKKYREIYELIVVSETGEEKRIETTDDHPFYVIGKEWVDTIELNPGDRIETEKHGAVLVKLVRLAGRNDVTYNIEVADFHTYYVTKLNLLVHNCGETVAKKVDPKQTGSYTNTHESGKTYVGKGSRQRSQKSGRREARRNDDPHVATDWTPAKNDREAFKQESRRLGAEDGPGSSSNYNRIEPPGTKYRQQDGGL